MQEITSRSIYDERIVSKDTFDILRGWTRTFMIFPLAQSSAWN